MQQMEIEVGAVATKVCRKCGVEKVATDFEKSKASRGGYRNTCRKCRSEYMQTTALAKSSQGSKAQAHVTHH